ncbi:Arm DNA-binding domain-containing protein [Gammaproteobacteria bacterium]|nr:Arm DNA-binding domain-containing protein [Gammaproteobacteria bacterium]
MRWLVDTVNSTAGGSSMQNLTATEAKKAKATNKTIKISEGDGLCLKVNTNGDKYWHYDYRFTCQIKTLALGVYPEITLKKAR